MSFHFRYVNNVPSINWIKRGGTEPVGWSHNSTDYRRNADCLDRNVSWFYSVLRKCRVSVSGQAATFSFSWSKHICPSTLCALIWAGEIGVGEQHVNFNMPVTLSSEVGTANAAGSVNPWYFVKWGVLPHVGRLERPRFILVIGSRRIRIST